METGDFSWLDSTDREVVVERKKVTDLIHSIRDGRWSKQIPRLMEKEVPIVLLEGNYREYLKHYRVNGFTPDGLDGIIVAAELGGVVIATAERGECPDRIVKLYQQTQKSSHSSLRPVRPKPSGSGNLAALALVMALPGLGEQTARKLLDRYRTPAEVFMAIEDGPMLGVQESKREAWKRVLYEAQ